MSQTRISIQPQELKVETRGLRCPQGFQCSGHCLESIEEIIRGMVRIRELS
jgi:hypothetical protein